MTNHPTESAPEPLAEMLKCPSGTERTLVGLELKPAARTKRLPPRKTPHTKKAWVKTWHPAGQASVATLWQRSHAAFGSGDRQHQGDRRGPPAGRYDQEVIDDCQQDGLLRNHQIVVLPKLIKHLPSPIRRMVGDLSDTESVLLSLGLDPDDADAIAPNSNDPNADC